MAIKIKTFEEDGLKYVSVKTYKKDKWFETSFEYTDEDKIPRIVSMINLAVNQLIDGPEWRNTSDDPSR